MTFNSDLKYISLDSTSKKYDLNGLHCTLKNETVRNAIKKSSSGKKITIRGKITDVGEVLGYYFDAYEIVNK